MTKLCDFCYMPLEECNCPGEMAPRKTGQQYFEALCRKRPKILAEGVVEVNSYQAVDSALKKNSEYQKDDFDKYAPVELKYLSIPQGTRLKITIEVLDDENS